MRVEDAEVKVSRVILAVASVYYFSAVTAANACSAIPIPPERVVHDSDVILRAKVISATGAKGDAVGEVTLEVLEVLGGHFQATSLTLPGRIRNYEASKGRVIPYHGNDCARASGCGGCTAHDYKQGGQYLLLLKSGKVDWAPLSPTNEEVSDTNDPWVLWVKSEVQRTPGRQK